MISHQCASYSSLSRQLVSSAPKEPQPILHRLATRGLGGGLWAGLRGGAIIIHWTRKMSKKKQPKNGFYYFMVDVQQELRQQGRFVPMREMPTLAGPRWSVSKERIHHLSLTRACGPCCVETA